jgi:hypothetical protein
MNIRANQCSDLLCLISAFCHLHIIMRLTNHVCSVWMFALGLDIGYSGGASPEYTDFSCFVDLDIEAGYSG